MKSLINYLTYNTGDLWRSVDAYFPNGVGCVALSLLPIKVANASFMNCCNQSPLRLPKVQDQISVMLCWHPFSWRGRGCVSFCLYYKSAEYIKNASDLPKSIVCDYQYDIIMRPSIEPPKKKNPRLKRRVQVKSRNTQQLWGIGMGLAHHEVAGRLFGWVWDRTQLCLWTESRQVARFPDPFLTLYASNRACLTAILFPQQDDCTSYLPSQNQ